MFMAHNTGRNRDRIPGWLIVVAFCMGFWPGAILLGIRLMQDANIRDNGAYRRSDSEWAKNAQDVTYQPVERQAAYNAQGQRTYVPPQSQPAAAQTQTNGERAKETIQGGQNPDGTYRYVYPRTAHKQTNPKTTKQTTAYQPQQASSPSQSRRATPRIPLLEHRRLSPKIGRGMRTAGNIILGCGVFVSAISFLGMWASGVWFFDTFLPTSIVALCCCTPGAVLSIIGSKRHDRVMRCRTYATIIGSRRWVDINQLAAAIPTRYSKCCEDLNWMLGEGLLQGMYIDAANRALVYPDAQPSAQPQPETDSVPARPKAQVDANGKKRYPEELRIRQLNDDIQDEYVSERMDRLEELTHKILSYAEEHPEKEPRLRQFHNHYLPKTLSILESYARMERMGVEGGNIGSAMKDVEDIMDKLVLGFEKQLDALFDSEAMDVTTDISVLESMMSMEGLSDLDPFGSMKQNDDLLTL